MYIRFILLIIGLILAPLNLFSEEFTGSFTITYDDCRLVNASLDKVGTVNFDSSQGVETRCIKKSKDVMCDYVHEQTGKLKNQPSHYTVDYEDDNYLLLSNELNSTRVHMNKKTMGVILSSYVSFFETNPNFFGVKFCSGSFKF